MRDLEKRLRRLEQRTEARGRVVVTLIVNHGEDGELIAANWRTENPGPEPDDFVLITIFAEPPRLNLASRQSVLEVLPHVKAFAEHGGVDVDEWRRVAEVAGVNYDAIEAARPLSDAVQ